MHRTPEIVFFSNLWNLTFLLLYYSARKYSTSMVIKDILLFVLNTKKPLSDIWLLRYKQNKFWCFIKTNRISFLSKTPKTVLLISQQTNIAQRLFCIQNKRQDTLYSYPYSCCSFFTSWVIKQQKNSILNFLKNTQLRACTLLPY